MSNHYYRFTGDLNRKLATLFNDAIKIKDLRNQFLKDKGLLENGMSYYSFSTKVMLSPEQLALLDIPPFELKKDGTPRKNSKFMHNLQTEYDAFLTENGVDIQQDADQELRDIFMLKMIEFGAGRTEYVYFSVDDTMYYRGNRPLRDDIIDAEPIEELTFYQAKDAFQKQDR